MISPCTILDLGRLTEITDKYHGEDRSIHARIRADLLSDDGATWFLEDGKALCYEKIGNRKVQAHIYSTGRDQRGKALRDFAVKTGRYILDNTEVTTILNFVEPDRRDLKLFMKMIGSDRIGQIPGTNQILYVSTGTMGIREDK